MYALLGDWPEVYQKILKLIKEEGELVAKSKCIYNLNFKINPDQVLILPEKNWKWSFIELYDRLNPSYENPGKSYQFRPHWKKKLQAEGGQFTYNYHDLLKNQITQVISQLSSSKNTKQAVMTIYSENDCLNWKSLSRTPCTLSLQFFVSKNKELNMSVTMRTNDVINLLIYDVFHHSMIQRLIASRLGLKVGFYSHSCNIAYYQKRREVTGYIDRMIAKQIRYCKITSGDEFYRELICSIFYPENGDVAYTNKFVEDFNKVIQLLLYNNNIQQYNLDFFKLAIGGG